MKEHPIYCPTATTLVKLVKYYKAHFISALKNELGQTTVCGSLFNKNGKLHPHQYHIGIQKCQKLVSYLKATNILKYAHTAVSFDAFVDYVGCLCIKSGIVKGRKDLIIFDIAKRLWPQNKSFGNNVYLYGTGANEAAHTLLGIKYIPKKKPLHDFVAAKPTLCLHYLNPVEFENFLCVMKEDIDRLKMLGYI